MLFKAAFLLFASAALTAPSATAQAAEEMGEDPLAKMLTHDERSSGAQDPSKQLESPASHEVWARIRNGFKMERLDCDLVDSQLAAFSRNSRGFSRTAERAGLYLYHIVGQVEARGMPMELALLPFVESSFIPTALSPAKASGLWQFIPSTGSNFSLEQNLWKDERRDVIESTRAALDYFQKLYDIFHDWQLCLAAYNWGEGNVQRAIDRNAAAGLPTDYLHLRMPAETANYVPRLEAIKRIIQSPETYGIKLPDIGSEPYFVKVFRDKDIDIKTAAKLAKMSLSEFRMLNPGFNRPVIVGAHENAMLIPADNLDTFMENLAIRRSSGRRVASWQTHRMQPGESLLTIAESYGMTVDEIREANNIPSNRRVAQNSLLLVRTNSDEAHSEIEGSNSFFKLEAIPAIPKIQYRQMRYRVRKGDTLNSIANRLHVSRRSIIVANHLRSASIKPGQMLLVTAPVIQRAPNAAVMVTENSTFRNSHPYRLRAMPVCEVKTKRRISRSLGKQGHSARRPASRKSRAARASRK